MNRKTLWLSAATALLAVMSTASMAQERVVNVYNWSDYIDESIIEEFTKETGIKVVYDVFDSNEILETKLLAGGSGYDIVVPTSNFLVRQIEAGVYQKLDKSKLPNISNMWDVVTERVAKYDPGNEYSINYMWGTVGIGYNQKKIKDALGIDKIDSWDVVFKPENLSKLADCGVYMLDSPSDILPTTFLYLGMDPEAKTAEDFAKAEETLMAIRPYIRKFHSSEYINALANGDICLALGYSGDVLQARKRAREAKNGVEVAYLIPKEGALMWFDSFVMPADAENKDNAYAFINFMNQPENAGKNSSFLQYATGNAEGRKLVDPETAKDPGIYPPDEVVKRLYTITPFDEKSQKVVNRMLTRIKTGR
jgi:putrescine transport system substrate-binding protein